MYIYIVRLKGFEKADGYLNHYLSGTSRCRDTTVIPPSARSVGRSVTCQKSRSLILPPRLLLLWNTARDAIERRGRACNRRCVFFRNEIKIAFGKVTSPFAAGLFCARNASVKPRAVELKFLRIRCKVPTSDLRLRQIDTLKYVEFVSSISCDKRCFAQRFRSERSVVRWRDVA